jgi:hypothetical protein
MATIDSILGKYDARVCELGLEVREFLLQELKEIMEYPDGPANIIGYGYGPGYKDLICTIIPSKKGIKVGFYRGSELPDPKKLLAGAGKVHRHVEIKSREDLSKPALKKLVMSAVQAHVKRKKESKNKSV